MNHLEGHIYANFLEHGDPQPPYVCLLVSGGHTMLVFMPEEHRYEVLGQTLDDAAGEAFDKIARFMGLGFPGGPVIDELARRGEQNDQGRGGSEHRRAGADAQRDADQGQSSDGAVPKQAPSRLTKIECDAGHGQKTDRSIRTRPGRLL